MKQPGQQVGTIVGSSVHLTGAIKDTSDITVFGGVDGEISSDEKIIIEESARVKGPIHAKEVIVSGYVNGTITAGEKIELNSSGTIKGNVETKDLLIHSGSVFIGKCQMPDRQGENEEFLPEKENDGENDDKQQGEEKSEDEADQEKE
ncbi:MAG: polymer-forming cytoskeletal protein [Candidatus Berkelbacteria bacterium]|nr:polymer-forming cytoskeletal protein [Candidatus Berkelbacteria bacterium]